MPQIVFSQTVSPLTGLFLEEISPLKGKVTSVTLHFPTGCNLLVKVRVGFSHPIGSNQFCPLVGYIALDNASPTFTNMTDLVERDQTIWVEIRNSDNTYSHKITAIVTISRGEVKNA